MKCIFGIFCSLCLLVFCGCSGAGTDQKTAKTVGKNIIISENHAAKEKDPSQRAETGNAEAVVKPLPKVPEYRINPADWSILPISDVNKKAVLLTIDDAPDRNAVEMARIMNAMGIKAIFFVNGHFIETPEGKEKLKQIHRMGFPIGNHTYNHVNLKDIPEKEQYHEIAALNDAVEKIIGKRPKFFRAPYGANTPYSTKVAAQEKMAIMNWTYGYDWQKPYQSKNALINIMVESPFLKNGANLLLHDRSWTKEALPGIISGLRNKGYDFINPERIEVPK